MQEPGGSAAGLVERVLFYETESLPRLVWLLAYGDVRQGGAVITAMRQVLLLQEQKQQHTGMASTTTAAMPKSAGQRPSVVDTVALVAAALLETHAVASTMPAPPPWLNAAGGPAAPGSPRLQLLLSHAVRQLLPPLCGQYSGCRGALQVVEGSQGTVASAAEAAAPPGELGVWQVQGRGHSTEMPCMISSKGYAWNGLACSPFCLSARMRAARWAWLRWS